MKISDLIFPLGVEESRELYASLAFLGARVFATSENRTVDWTPEETLAVAAEESRFDYRLLYVVVAFLAEHVQKLHPFRLRESVTRMASPAVWGLIYEFSRKIKVSRDLEDFFSIVLREIQPVSPQMFFLPLRKPNSHHLRRIVERTPEEFARWGFYGEEVPLLKELKPKGHVRTLAKETRKRILRKLFLDKKRISVRDYLEALDFSLTRQQAHKDLVAFPKVNLISDRRGRRYSISD